MTPINYRKLYKDQVKMAYDRQIFPTISSFICALIMAFVLKPVVPSKIVASWVGYVFIVFIVRWIMAYFYIQKKPDDTQMEKWGQFLLLGVILIASAWGIGAVVLFPTDSFLHQTFLLIVCLGICSGALTSLSVFFSSIVCFLTIILVPLAIRFLLVDDTFHLWMGLMILIYYVVLILVSRANNKMITEAMTLRYQLQEQEKDLQQSEERYKDFVENLPLGFYRCTFASEDKFNICNPFLMHMLGYRVKEDLYATSFNEICENESDYRLFRVELMSKGFLEGEEMKIKKKDGTIIKCSITAKVFRNRDGKIDYFDGIMREIV